MIQNLNSRARSILIDASIPLRFWAELINTATYLQARTPTIALQGQTPYEALYTRLVIERKDPDSMTDSDATTILPEIGHLWRIRCVAYHRIPDESFKNKTMLKLAPRSKRCMLLGYTDSTKIWKLWDQSGNGGKGRVIKSSDVIFKEEKNAMTTTTEQLELLVHNREMQEEMIRENIVMELQKNTIPI